MTDPKYRRRTQADWQQIINQFQESGLSGARFCKQQEIPYASFSKWRQRLLGMSSEPASSLTQTQKPDFIDLTQLSSACDGLSITLKLGNDIELLLTPR